MRRSLAEWLLVPLFLLPFAAGAGFCLLAREIHERSLAPLKSDAPRLVREWLSPESGAGAWIPDHFARDFAGAADRYGEPADYVPFRMPALGGVVRLRPEALGPEPWIVTDDYPAGLDPAALADAKVRLAVETGSPPAAVARVDAATVEFAALLAGPDIDRLRAAPLPLATKRWFLRRWRADGAADAALGEADRLLSLLAAMPDRVPVGASRTDAGWVLRGAAGGPVVVLPERPGPAWSFTSVGDPESPVSLTWEFPPREVPFAGTIWSGSVDAPLAGQWSFRLKRRAGWWNSPFFTRWIGPVSAGALAFLLLPTALLVSIRRRRRLDEARVRFVNELAHDLRTPLTSLRLYADMLAGGKAKPADRERYVEVVARESARLTGLLGNLLDLSRLERGAREFEKTRVDVEQAVETAVRDFAALYPKRADDVRVAGPDGVVVFADRDALTRILGNLLDNAGKFTPDGTPIRIEYAQRLGGGLRLTVADEGPGIPAADAERIFRRYERGRGSATDSVPGTGLGLSLVRELAEGMGGGVRLVRPEKGVAFEVRLPG